MKQIFRSIPLPFKLMLIGAVPFLFILLLSIQLYREKANNIHYLENCHQSIRQSEHIFELIELLQNELKYSYSQVVRNRCKEALQKQFILTDSMLREVKNHADSNLTHFERYTFLDQLPQIRRRTLQGEIPPSEITTFYINVIYRLNSINPLTFRDNRYTSPIYKNLETQRLLSQTSIFLGILRSNIFNTLFTGQDPKGTLYGLQGVFDMYRSYQEELRYKAPASFVRFYESLKKEPAFRAVSQYLDEAFTHYRLDSQYTAETWWQSSGLAMDQFKVLQTRLRTDIEQYLEHATQTEINAQQRMMTVLVGAELLLLVIVWLTTRSLHDMIRELKAAAQKLALGRPGLKFKKFPNDVIGKLALSITQIDQNNQSLALAAQQVGKGNFDHMLVPRSPEDLLGNALAEMKSSLQTFTLQEKQRQQLVSKAILSAQEKERKRIGEDLHDNINQMLTSAKLYLELARSHEDNRMELMMKSTGIVSRSIEEIRKLSHHLVNPTLRESNLVTAVKVLTEDLQITVPVCFTLDMEESVEQFLSEEVKTMLYRIIQEQLTNIIKYAGATSVLIRLCLNKGQLQLRIADDGQGFDMHRTRTGIGLTNMANRIGLFNGKMDLDSAPGKGCTVTITFELEEIKKSALRDPKGSTLTFF